MADGTDDLDDVRLQWPAREPVDAPVGVGADDDVAEEEPAAEAVAEVVAPWPAPVAAGELDAVSSPIRALGLRLDALGAAVGQLRSGLGDRFDAYADAAAGATRQADDALEDHRRTIQRAMAELRRATAQHDDALRRLGGRLEEVAGAVDAVLARLEVEHPPTVADVDVDAEGMSPIATGLAVVRGKLEELAARPEADTASIAESLARIEARLDALEGSAAAAAPPAAAVDAAEVARLLEGSTVGSGSSASVDLAPLVTGMQVLAANLDQVRTLVEAVVDTMPASQEGSGAELAEQVAAAVAERLIRGR